MCRGDKHVMRYRYEVFNERFLENMKVLSKSLPEFTALRNLADLSSLLSC